MTEIETFQNAYGDVCYLPQIGDEVLMLTDEYRDRGLVKGQTYIVSHVKDRRARLSGPDPGVSDGAIFLWMLMAQHFLVKRPVLPLEDITDTEKHSATPLPSVESLERFLGL